MSNTPHEKIVDLRNKIIGLLEQQPDLLRNEDGMAITTSALLEVTLNLMLMHYGASFTEKTIQMALRDFLAKHKAN